MNMLKLKAAAAFVMAAVVSATASGCSSGGENYHVNSRNSDTVSSSHIKPTDDTPSVISDKTQAKKAASDDTEKDNEPKSEKTSSKADNTSSQADTEELFVNGSGAKLYSEMGGSGDVIKIVPENDKLTILEKTAGGYWKVQTSDGTVGYIAMENIKETSGGDIEQNDPAQAASSYQESSQTDSDKKQDDNGLGKGNTEYSDSFEDAVSKAQNNAGGNWAACLQVFDGSKPCAVNDSQMQAASLIKLFIMGAIYENYDEYAEENGNIDTLLRDMITVSDNTAANTLVGILGNGDTTAGRGVVTAYCQNNGYKYSSMGRLLLESTEHGDNYTSVGDCARFLTAVYNKELPHSNDMMKYLKQQQRTSKIPAGVPDGVQTANKTGELITVQNDAAVVFADKPYVLCVMSEDVYEGAAVSSIVTLSSDVYNMVNK